MYPGMWRLQGFVKAPGTPIYEGDAPSVMCIIWWKRSGRTMIFFPLSVSGLVLSGMSSFTGTLGIVAPGSICDLDFATDASSAG